MNFRLVIFCVLFLVLSQQGMAQDSLSNLTLEHCIALAIKNNQQSRQGEINSELSKVNLQQAKSNMLPDISMRFNHNISKGRGIDPASNLYVQQKYTSGNQDLNASVLLSNGLALLRAIRQQSFAYQATAMDELSIKDQLTLDVILAYINILTSSDMLSLAKNQQALTLQQLDRLKVLQEQGAVQPAEYYDLKGQYANDQLAVADAANSLSNARVEITRLLNIPYTENISFASLGEAPLSPSDQAQAAELYQSAAARLGYIRSADLWKQSAVYALKSTRSAFFPSLYLGGGLTSAYSSSVERKYINQVDDNLGRFAGLTLQIPILSGLRTRSAVARAKLDLKSAELVAETRRNELQQTTEQAAFNLKTAKEKYLTLQEQVAAYKESYRIAEVRFSAGAINSVEFLTSKNNMDRAGINLVITRYEWHLRQQIVDFYNGVR